MSIFGKLFKKPASPATDEPAAGADPASHPNLIRVLDKYGREFVISRYWFSLRELLIHAAALARRGRARVGTGNRLKRFPVF